MSRYKRNKPFISLVGIAYIPYRISLISEHGIERECERSENARSEQEKHKPPPLYISLYIEVLILVLNKATSEEKPNLE